METTQRVGGVRIVSATIEQEQDPDSNPSDYICIDSLDDAERMEAWNRGDWEFVGVYAKVVFEGDDGWKMEVRSPGLWGIESDSAYAYFAEIAAEEAEQLVDDLISNRSLSPGVVVEVDRMLGAAVANL